jgi:hypothetical protein
MRTRLNPFHGDNLTLEIDPLLHTVASERVVAATDPFLETEALEERPELIEAGVLSDVPLSTRSRSFSYRPVPYRRPLVHAL